MTVLVSVNDYVDIATFTTWTVDKHCQCDVQKEQAHLTLSYHTTFTFIQHSLGNYKSFHRGNRNLG